MDFDAFFKMATGSHGDNPAPGHDPYDYQKRLACGEQQSGEPRDSWLQHGADCRSALINIPTGLGKTAAVILAWLWNRVALEKPGWPRRLVYCLPMRTLVEQTEDCARTWVGNLQKYAAQHGFLDRLPAVHILMGGEEKSDWDIYPEKNAILIGTQDMLLSRALNRGYGMSRYRWPMHFGLLNNDCLWVMDETQLMGVGVETSAQLNGFRQRTLGGSALSWWMSATSDPQRLETVDNTAPGGGWPTVRLSASDLSSEPVRRRVDSSKPLSSASIVLDSSTKGPEYAKRLAELIREKHRVGTFTLVVLNRVNRAQEVFRILRDAKIPAAAEVALIHSRFRPGDRAVQQAVLEKEGDRIVIATQAIEAGVDISARLLITELAPWSSLVQRFGRCNRAGSMVDAEVLWIDIQPKDDKDDLALPYDLDSLGKAREALGKLLDAGPASVGPVRVAEKTVIRPVLRRKDLLDLFDTTPDLCGNDLDIGRYIRDGEDIDVQVYWRSLKGEPLGDADKNAPSREELCRVSLLAFVKFLGKTIKAYAWNPLFEHWDQIDHLHRPRPGGVYLLNTASGGYTPALGWTGVAKLDPKDPLAALSRGESENESYGANRQTWIGKWIELKEHTNHVCEQADRLLEQLPLEPSLKAALQTASLWHDLGKAHPAFQQSVMPIDRTKLWAKSETPTGRPVRRGFRHELASALIWLQSTPPETPERDLVAYLIAAHHGKVRLSIRSLPNEEPPKDRPNADRFARGVCDGDVVPGEPFEEIRIGDLTVPPVSLDLGYMELGSDERRGPSWLARTIGLRDRFGPFELAYLETLLRVADMMASAQERESSTVNLNSR